VLGGVVHGIGATLFMDALRRGGAAVAVTYADYLLPTADGPRIRSIT
jgi:CO/xanthine dehydrogenase Mo-binding subunit